MKRTLILALASSLALSLGVAGTSQAAQPFASPKVSAPIVLASTKIVAKKPFFYQGKKVFPTSDGKFFHSAHARDKYLYSLNTRTHHQAKKKHALHADIARAEERVYALRDKRDVLRERLAYRKAYGLSTHKTRKRLKQISYELEDAKAELAYLEEHKHKTHAKKRKLSKEEKVVKALKLFKHGFVYGN